MNYESSELYFSRGIILLRMGYYQESLEAFEKALQIKVNHRYYFHKAVALHRLGQTVYVEEALRQAIDCLKGSREQAEIGTLKKYERYLYNVKNRDRSRNWWEWWFVEGTGWRKTAGIVFILVTIFMAIGPLIPIPLGLWSNTDRMVTWNYGWLWYLVPVVTFLVLLLSPGFRHVRPQELELEPIIFLKRDISATTPPDIITEPELKEEKTRRS